MVRCESTSADTTTRASRLAHSTLVEPEPAKRSPSPVISKNTGIAATSKATGNSMFRGRGGTLCATSSAGTAVRSPCPAAALRCASAIGPISTLRQMVKAASATALRA